MEYRTVNEFFVSENTLAPDGYECSCPANGCWSGHEEQAAKGPDGSVLCPACNAPVAYACEAIDPETMIDDDDGEHDEPMMVRIVV